MKNVEVVCAVIKKNDKYFICQRGPGRALENFWEFPGGKIESHETKEQALVREIKEELGGTIKPLAFLMTVEHAYEDLGEYQPFNIIMHAYLCELSEGNLQISEHIDSKWVSKEELAEFDFAPADRPIVYRLMNPQFQACKK